ncbi:hypothetical protein FRC00_009651 [Tulasnella sp. 408]|nr:hypothetical protein FRC00_009651 [Tulasnella sp. 408]
MGSDRIRVRNPQAHPRRRTQAAASAPIAGPSNRPPPGDHANEDLAQSSDDEMSQGGGGLGQPLHQREAAINRFRRKINSSIVAGGKMELNALQRFNRRKMFDLEMSEAKGGMVFDYLPWAGEAERQVIPVLIIAAIET